MQLRDRHGPATVRFDNGETYEVEADLHFSKARNIISGHGMIRSNQAFSIGMNMSPATISFGDFTIGIVVASANSDGTCTFATNGGPHPS